MGRVLDDVQQLARPFRCRQRRVCGLVVVDVEGELDLCAAPQLEDAVAEATRSGPVHVIVHVGGVSFMDAAGLGALVAARDRAERSGTQMRLVGLHGTARRVVDMTDMRGTFVTDDTLTQALADLVPRRSTVGTATG